MSATFSDPGRRHAVVRRLAEKLQHFARPDRQGRKRGQRSTGIQAIDSLLPDVGIEDGSLVEWLSNGPGSGAGTLALAVAFHRLRTDPTGAACVVVDSSREFYPPAIVRWDYDPDRLIVAHPSNVRETLWSLEQALRCLGVGVVVGWLGAVGAQAFRRLQLAAESGGGVGLLLRPSEYRGEPSWAAVRLSVSAISGMARPDARKGVVGCATGPFKDSGRATLSSLSGRRLRVEPVHCRGRMAAGGVELEIDDETGDVRLVSRLADPTAATCRARAR